MAVYRLDKWLCLQGLGSRRDVGLLIRKGRVCVDNAVVKKPETKVTDQQQVVVDGQPQILEKYVYYMMNKPSGVLSASRDKKSKTVIDILPKELGRPNLFPAGRLDKDTEGFLLITDDGELAHRILAPKNKVPKTYLVHLDKDFDQKNLIEDFNHGILLGGGEKTSGAELVILETTPKPIVQLTIYEGMFHQVKRMFAKYGLKVTYLKRIKIGNLELDPELGLGDTRKINQTELKLMTL